MFALPSNAIAPAKRKVCAAQTQSSAMIDVGGCYHFKHNTNEQIPFCYGRSVAGQTENSAYLGIYWTGGKDAEDSSPGEKGDAARSLPLPGRNGF